MLTTDEQLLRYEARYQAASAVNTRRLEKPSKCEQCGATTRLCGHHDDYTAPLALRWLCYPCHAIWHSRQLERVAGLA